MLPTVLALLLAAACAPLPSPPTLAGPAGIPAVPAVPEPARVDWRRTVAAVEVVGVDTRPDPEELARLDRALRELPSRLLTAGAPRRLYRVREERSDGDAAAYTLGPDVYLVDAAFAPDTTTLDLVRLLAHELTHVAQYRALTGWDTAPEDADPLPTSPFVADFAATVGWSRATAPGSPLWRLAPGEVTTAYGAESPVEDQAESVAEVVAGPEPSVSPSRVAWVERWLGSPATTLAGGRPWAPRGAARARGAEPLVAPPAGFATAGGVVETVTYVLATSSPPAARLAARLTDALARRGVAGRLRRAADDRILRYVGTFTRADGVAYHVELWDFRHASGFVDPPPRPVVTYFVAWR